MAVATQVLEAAVGPESVRLNTTNYFAPPRCHTAIFACVPSQTVRFDVVTARMRM